MLYVCAHTRCECTRHVSSSLLLDFFPCHHQVTCTQNQPEPANICRNNQCDTALVPSVLFHLLDPRVLSAWYCEKMLLPIFTAKCKRELEEVMATHFSILAWRIPWTEQPGGLQSMGLQRDMTEAT